MDTGEQKGKIHQIQGNLKLFFLRNERHLSAVTFLIGFILDTLFLPRIDLPITWIIISAYFFTIALGIIILQRSFQGDKGHKLSKNISTFLPLLIQLVFGALFSSLFVYYFRSASLVASWPFIAILVAMMIGNEIFRSRYKQFEFQVIILFFTLFTYSIFFVPMLLNRLDTATFILSGMVSIMIILAYLLIIFILFPQTRSSSQKIIIAGITTIYFGINLLYFTNIIPPIPLSLKAANVYHNVSRDENGNYAVMTESQSWRDRYLTHAPPYHHVANDPVFFYSAVFAPTKLKTPIFHEWQYFNASKKEWQFVNRVDFPIVGGRDDGYRGYSVKTAITPGRWRVLVKTGNGQILGRSTFTVIGVDTPPPPQQKIL